MIVQEASRAADSSEEKLGRRVQGLSVAVAVGRGSGGRSHERESEECWAPTRHKTGRLGVSVFLSEERFEHLDGG
jgi:hypothetical protein